MGASGLGSLLVKEGFLTEQDRLTITKTCGQGSWAFAKSILAIGLLDEDELAAFFAERTRYQIAPKDFLNHLDQAAIQSVDRRLVSKLEVIPLKKDHGKITVGVVDPLDRSTLKQLEFFTGFEVDPVVIPLSQLYEGLTRIDPDFRYQPTALTHFLQNHAQSAWVRQKLENDDGTSAIPSAAPRQGRNRSSANDIEEIYDDLPEIEEVEDSVEIEEDESGVESENSTSEFDMEIDEEADSEIEPEDELDDPFAGAASASLSDQHNDDLGAEISSRSRKIDNDDLLELDDGSDEEFEEDEKVSTNSPDSSTVDFDFDSELSSIETASTEDEVENKDENENEEKADSELEALTETEEMAFDSNENAKLSADLVLEEEDTNIDALFKADGTPKEPKELDPFEGLPTLEDDDEFDTEPAVTEAKPQRENRPLKDQVDDFNFEMDEIKAENPPMSSFGFEETKPRAKPSALKDILDNMDDLEPSLDVSKLPGEELDRDLLADLHSEIEADDHSPNVDPSSSKINYGFNDEPSVDRAPSKPSRSSFHDEEETHIDLRSSPSLKSDDHDDDILLHPETANLKTQSDSGLNPTSAINELLVKLSLCWNPEGTLQVLRENLHKIGEAGALLNTKSQHQILWAEGNVIGLELGPAALLPMVKNASLNKWQSLELKSSESWTQKAMKLKIYRFGDWLWAHNLKVNDDTAIFRDTVESVVSQVTHKLGR
jgi:hypothetical protein